MVKLVNRAKMTTSSTGTGTITLGSASDGYQTFASAGVSNGDILRYTIEDGSNAWEIGTGTYTASGTTLSRTVSESSNSGNALNLSGNAVVFVTAIADDVGVRTYATISAMTSSTSAKSGALAYVTANTGLYQNNGNGWYKIATVNTSPTISAVQDASSGTTPFTLATDGTATVITITAADVDEGTDLTYSHSVTSGSLNGTTVTQGTGASENVFTVTPHASNATTFSLTFSVTDNINTAQSVNAFTLQFSSPYTIKNDSYDSLYKDFSGSYGAPNGGFVFNPNGTKLYYNTSGDKFVEYSMSTAYDIANASYVGNYDWGSQSGLSSSVYPDNGSFCIGDSGAKLYFTSTYSKKVYQFNFGSGSSAVSSLSYSSSNDYSLSSSQTGTGRAMLWNNNGSVFWLFTNSNSHIYEFTTSSSWNVAGSSHNATLTNQAPFQNCQGAFWNDDGTKLFLHNGYEVKQYSVSSAYDAGSTLTYENEELDQSAQKHTSYGAFVSGDFNRTATTIGGTSIDAGRKYFSMWNSAPISGGTPYNGTRIFRYSVG